MDKPLESRSPEDSEQVNLRIMFDALIYDSDEEAWLRFTGASSVHIAKTSDDVAVVLDTIETACSEGSYAVGYVSFEAASALRIPMDRQVIHELAQEYIVDDQRGIPYPDGMYGVRLEVLVHIVTGAITSKQNLYKCIERAGLEVKDLVLDSLASSFAVLSSDEKELGVILLDIFFFFRKLDKNQFYFKN